MDVVWVVPSVGDNIERATYLDGFGCGLVGLDVVRA